MRLPKLRCRKERHGISDQMMLLFSPKKFYENEVTPRKKSPQIALPFFSCPRCNFIMYSSQREKRYLHTHGKNFHSPTCLFSLAAGLTAWVPRPRRAEAIPSSRRPCSAGRGTRSRPPQPPLPPSQRPGFRCCSARPPERDWITSINDTHVIVDYFNWSLHLKNPSRIKENIWNNIIF